MCDPANPELAKSEPVVAGSGGLPGVRVGRRLRPGPARSAAQRFRQDQSGAMAVEFALVLFPLCILIFFVLENALVFWVTSALDNGLDASMRQFYVQSGASATSLLDAVRVQTQVGWWDREGRDEALELSRCRQVDRVYSYHLRVYYLLPIAYEHLSIHSTSIYNPCRCTCYLW